MAKAMLICSSRNLLSSAAQQQRQADRTIPATPFTSSFKPPPMVWWSDALAQVEPDWQKLHNERLEFVKHNGLNVEQRRRARGSTLQKYGELLFSIEAVLKNGLAQELIIGRAAMLGFLAAMSIELESGQSIWQQLSFRGLLSFLFVVGAVSMGSLATRHNETRESDLDTPFGPFTVNAERLNGQVAMIGFVLLLAIESAKGSALF